MDVSQKREQEKRVVRQMIALYCRRKHGGGALCPACAELERYAMARSDKCPFMESKTFCSNCRVHCYRPEMRAKIREVMRFSGPRMLLYHPVMALRHVYLTAREKRKLEGHA